MVLGRGNAGASLAEAAAVRSRVEFVINSPANAAPVKLRGLMNAL